MNDSETPVAAETLDLILYVMVDVDGNYVAHNDRDKLDELYSEEINDTVVHPVQTYEIVVNVPKPVDINVRGVIAPPNVLKPELRITSVV